MGQVEANLDFQVEQMGDTEYLVFRRSRGAPAEHIGVTVASWPVASVTDPMVAGAAADRKFTFLMLHGTASSGATAGLRAAIATRPVFADGPFPGADPAAFAAALTDAELKALGVRCVTKALPEFLRMGFSVCCSAP